MKNKKVIRKENKSGEFTTTHLSIVNDMRLTSTAFRLLTMILSDNDLTFNLSGVVYLKRLGLDKISKTGNIYYDKNQYYSAINNLIECGYMSKTPYKDLRGLKKYMYTISEYGNLNSNKQQEEVTQQEEVVTQQEEVVIKNNSTIFEPITEPEFNNFINNVVNKLCKDNINSGTIAQKESITKKVIRFYELALLNGIKPNNQLYNNKDIDYLTSEVGIKGKILTIKTSIINADNNAKKALAE